MGTPSQRVPGGGVMMNLGRGDQEGGNFWGDLGTLLFFLFVFFKSF